MMIFSDCSDLIGIRRPQDIKHFQYLRRCLLLIGAWPGKLLGEKDPFRLPYQIFNWIYTMFCFVGTGLYLYDNFGVISFFEIRQSLITEIMGVVTTSRAAAILLRRYDKPLQYFFNKIHLFHFKDKSKYAMKTHLSIHKLCHCFTVYSVGLVLWTAIFFNIPPLYNNISKGGLTKPYPTNFTYEHSAFYRLPFDYQHEIKGYLFISTFNWYASLLYAFLCSFHDLKLILYMFHLWGHLKIVIYNLEHFPRPGKVEPGTEYEDIVPHTEITHYSDEELVHVAQRLKDIINHHRLILRYIDDISNTYGLSVFVFFAFEQVTLCLLLLECSEMNPKALIRFGPLLLGLLQLLIQTSLVFELLTSKNDPLMRAVYNLPWECMDTKNRRLVHLMMLQTQKQLGFKAMGLVEVGLQTAATIIKTTISYFVMLRTVS